MYFHTTILSKTHVACFHLYIIWCYFPQVFNLMRPAPGHLLLISLETISVAHCPLHFPGRSESLAVLLKPCLASFTFPAGRPGQHSPEPRQTRGLRPQLLWAGAAGTGAEWKDRTQPRSRLEPGKDPGGAGAEGRAAGRGERTHTDPAPASACRDSRPEPPGPRPARCRRLPVRAHPPQPLLAAGPGRQLRQPHARSGAGTGGRKVSAVPWGWTGGRCPAELDGPGCPGAAGGGGAERRSLREDSLRLTGLGAVAAGREGTPASSCWLERGRPCSSSSPRSGCPGQRRPPLRAAPLGAGAARAP